MEEPIPSTGPIHAPVYSSINHADLGELLREGGFDVLPFEEDSRIGYRSQTEPRFTVQLQTPLAQRPGEYDGIFLYGYVNLSFAHAAAVIQATKLKTAFAHVDMSSRGRIAVTSCVLLIGGVTRRHLRGQLRYWQMDLKLVCDEIRKQARILSESTLH